MTQAEVITEQFMKLLEKEVRTSEKEIQDSYLEVVAILAALFLGRTSGSAGNFKLPKYTDTHFKALRTKLYELMNKFASNAAFLSLRKNEKILGLEIKAPVLIGWIDRKIQGITQRQRINKYVNNFKYEIEARIAMGIASGESEASLIKSVKKYLDSPFDNLIVDKRSDWKTRRLAVKFNSGKGNYKSSYASAKRMVRTEMLEHFRRADHLIWKSQKEVTGVLVYLSPDHPVVDMCDSLVGIYPKGFYFSGFHPSCICMSRPIIRGSQHKSVPSGAKDFMADEKNRKYYSKLPYMTENKKYWK